MDYTGFFLLLLSGTFSICSSLPLQYYYVNESASWFDAQSYCRANHIDLVTVADFPAVESVFGGVTFPDPKYLGNFWIGLSRSWHWITGDPVFSYSNWYFDQPNDGNSYTACGMTSTAGWFDLSCATILFFFCMDTSQTGSSRFILISNAKTWDSARAYCRQYYTDLAVINNAQEQQIINSYYGTNWIGLISSQWSDEKFYWYRYWKSGVNFETPVVSKCGVSDLTDSSKWNSFDCNLQYPFMCYSGLPTVPQEKYVFINLPKTWIQAQNYCRTNYFDLVTVYSKNDMIKITQIVDPVYSGSVWIGLQNGTTMNWGWSTGEEPATLYLNWAVGQPNGPGQCGVSINGTWYNQDCTVSQPFVCSSVTGYILVNDQKNWKDAQSFCRITYSDLASIRTPWERRQFDKVVSNGITVWIGLFQDNWQWSDQYSIFYRNWAQGHASSTSSTCVTTVTTNLGQWVSDDCNAQYPFICFKGDQPVSREYTFTNKLKTWLDAQTYCRMRYDDLATVDSLSDVQNMMTEVGVTYSGALWIGIQQLIPGQWVWSLGQTPVNNFLQWDIGKPGGFGTCALTHWGSWSDVTCGTSLYFLCYSTNAGYVLISSPRNWLDAQIYCRTYYTDLASIRSPSQYNVVSKLVDPGLYVWIGLFQDNWWWSDQSNMHFRSWRSGQPVIGTCGAMVTTDSGKWKSDTCTVKYPFMCYGPDKMRINQTLRLKISSGADLNNPLTQQAILDLIEKKVKELGIDDNPTVSWKVAHDNTIFMKDVPSVKNVPVLNNVC